MIDKTLFDSHIHPETPEMAPAHVLSIARQKKLSVCLVDHVFKDKHRIIDDTVKQQARDAFADVTYLHGCEADVYAPGKIALADELVSQMDVIMLSFTHVEQPSVLQGVDIRNSVQLANHFMQLFSAALDYDYVDVIGHPFSFFLEGVDNWEVYSAISSDDLITQIRKAKHRGIALEINARTLRMKDPRPQRAFTELANKEEALFSIGSDAHSVEDIGNTHEAWTLVDQLGIPWERIVFPQSSMSSRSGVVSLL